MKKLLVLIIGIYCSTSSLAASEKKSSGNIDKAIEIIKIACVTGERLEINVSGDGDVSFLKKGISGKISFTKEEINGVLKGTNQSLRSEENADIRTCMQQYVPKILDALLDAKTINKTVKDNDYYYLTNQRVPLDIPMAILDGIPLLTVAKVYEYNREKYVDLVLEIPHRKQYKFKLSTRKKNIKNSSQFKYRDKIYKVSTNHINLQEQNVTLSLVKYKDN
ncbi:hypothetical protein [Candidatus Venteria ishoeyi]|uniref:Uncharacterized protein n=1 Tax=Candidatus Venteria ishoeyi TaxID=1899563 RepID=A0A1H6FCW2_9GAMM|nr:hypothetical protein [Candidatus Venteria ishoeyi]SEH07922.1 Uncharacterised protein [Candidatus Venteria ishoeyi]